MKSNSHKTLTWICLLATPTPLSAVHVYRPDSPAAVSGTTKLNTDCAECISDSTLLSCKRTRWYLVYCQSARSDQRNIVLTSPCVVLSCAWWYRVNFQYLLHSWMDIDAILDRSSSRGPTHWAVTASKMHWKPSFHNSRPSSEHK